MTKDVNGVAYLTRGHRQFGQGGASAHQTQLGCNSVLNSFDNRSAQWLWYTQCYGGSGNKKLVL